jgi:hypothetical protein
MKFNASARHPRRGLLALAVAVAAALSVELAAPMVAAADTGPFSELEGNWTGGGTISLAAGTKERLRCRSVNAVSDQGNGLRQSLECVSDSYRFEVNASLASKDGRLSGDWSERTRNVSGSVSGRASRGSIQLSVASSVFQATMSISLRGRGQSVVIRPQGVDVTEVSIQLSKS